MHAIDCQEFKGQVLKVNNVSVMASEWTQSTGSYVTEGRYTYGHEQKHINPLKIFLLDGGEWSASRPGRFTPKERTPGTHWIGGWVYFVKRHI